MMRKSLGEDDKARVERHMFGWGRTGYQDPSEARDSVTTALSERNSRSVPKFLLLSSFHSP